MLRALKKSNIQKNDKGIEVEIAFAENLIITLCDIATFIDKEFVGAEISTLKIDILNGSKTPKSLRSSLKKKVKKAIQYYREHGLKMTYLRIKTEIKCVLKKLKKRKTTQNTVNSKMEYLETHLKELQEQILQQYLEISNIKTMQQQLEKDVDAIKKKQDSIERIANETLWAQVWNSTVVEESTWLKNKTFSPGRFAVGYPFLYVLYRILDEVKPQNILELGLGQSTKLISQYAQAYPSAVHKVVESDPNWIDFFSYNYKMPQNTEVVCLETEIIEKEPGQKVRIFKEFVNTFKDQRFDYLCIDAPRGDLSNYSRIDILPLLPCCLKENFIIMVHDCQRIGELNTVKSIEHILTINNIIFHKKNYQGMADTILICSEKLKFLSTL